MRTLLFATLIFVTFAAEAANTKTTVISSGLCDQSKPEERYAQPQSTAGYATLGELHITKQTDVVPLRPGIGFGFTWRAEGLPEVVKVVYLIEHPLITRPDGKQLRSFEEPMVHQTEGGALQTTDCYMLSEPHEMVPGDWSLTIMYNGAPLVKRTFHVVPQR
jgi:hypothetical protein